MTRRMSTDLCVNFTRQALAALAHAHAAKIIHCDVKPENFIIFPGNRLRLTDFGFSKIAVRSVRRASGSGTVGYLAPERQQDIAQETMDVYAPLAHRFGIAKMKWELEDRSFKILQPERYFEIEAGIKQTRKDRERIIESLRGPLSEALASAGVNCRPPRTQNPSRPRPKRTRPRTPSPMGRT